MGFVVQKMKVLICFFIFYSFVTEAIEIRFPDEELASESVLPILDPSRMVLNRNTPLKSRFELGVGAGFGLDEPFYFPIYGIGMLGFYITEVHSVRITGTYFPPILSGAGKALQAGEGLGDKRFDPHKVSYPQMMSFIDYQYSPFYGKISLAKNWVMNISIYGFIGPGLIIFNDNEKTLAVNLGIGQKFYFNKWLGIRGGLGFYGYRGPSPAKLDLGDTVTKVPYGQLKSQNGLGVLINIVANIGVVILI